MSDKTLALDASLLSRGYGNRWALQGLNLQLAAGRSLLLAGANGAGKTTMLRLLATTLRPTGGELRGFGHDSRRNFMQARQRIALLTHRTQLYSELTALENLDVTRRLLGRPSARDADLALLERVGLEERGDDRTRGFSAGMRKRLAFARVLLQDSDIILLDEHFGQLDPAGFKWVETLVGDLVDRGKSLVVSTHLVDRMAPLLRSGLVLSEGRMAWVGTAAELPAALSRELQA